MAPVSGGGLAQAAARGCAIVAVLAALLMAGILVLYRREAPPAAPPEAAVGAGTAAGAAPTNSPAAAGTTAPKNGPFVAETAVTVASGPQPGTPTDAIEDPGHGGPTPATPTPLSSAERGSVATCHDRAGDVTAANGAIPELALPGTDLTKVEVILNSDVITVTFTATERLPIESGPSPLGGDASILWYVLTRSGDEGAYLLQAELLGSHWYADAVDLVEARRRVATPDPARSRLYDPPFARGNTVMVTFPLHQLPKLAVPFTWTAGTEWADFAVYGDVCPDRSVAGPRVPSSRLVPPQR